MNLIKLYFWLLPTSLVTNFVSLGQVIPTVEHTEELFNLCPLCQVFPLFLYTGSL